MSYGAVIRKAAAGLKGNQTRGERKAMSKSKRKRGGHSAAHPGFRAVAAKIAAQRGVSSERAGAILASSSRHASAAAKRKNPRLLRVKG